MLTLALLRVVRVLDAEMIKQKKNSCDAQTRNVSASVLLLKGLVYMAISFRNYDTVKKFKYKVIGMHMGR